MKVTKIKTAEAVSTRLSLKELERVETLIKEGFYINISDFVRDAVREKLTNTQVMYVRRVSLKEAKKEILGRLKKNAKAYPSDIALELNLDFDIVNESVEELIKEGVVEK